jgi:transaldolase
LELWISGTIDEVVEAANSGLAATVATNPTLIAKWTANGRTLEDVITELCQRVDVPVYVQLHGPDVDGYLYEMDALRKISGQISPKLVATHEGIKAAYRLANEGVKPLVTAVYTINQAFMAAAAGAACVAPYVGRIEDAGEDAIWLIEEIANLYHMHDANTRIIAASIRTTEQARDVLLAGAHAIVVFYDVFQQLFESELMQESIEGFEKDWATFTFEGRADRKTAPVK